MSGQERDPSFPDTGAKFSKVATSSTSTLNRVSCHADDFGERGAEKQLLKGLNVASVPIRRLASEGRRGVPESTMDVVDIVIHECIRKEFFPKNSMTHAFIFNLENDPSSHLISARTSNPSLLVSADHITCRHFVSGLLWSKWFVQYAVCWVR